MPASDDYATELRGPGRSMIKHRDPLAIAVAALSILTQVGMWIWWGGRMDQRVESHDQRLAAVEQRSQQREDAKAVVDGAQTTAIEVIKSQLSDIKLSVDRIDRKIPERAR
jgi:hypothetical protein